MDSAAWSINMHYPSGMGFRCRAVRAKTFHITMEWPRAGHTSTTRASGWPTAGDGYGEFATGHWHWRQAQAELASCQCPTPMESRGV